MGIIDLDKIIIRQTIVGVNCQHCGGTLKMVSVSRFKNAALTLISFGLLGFKKYRCETCGNEVLFFWKRTKPGT